MVLTYPRQAIGIFPDYQSVEAALKELESSGFPMNKISLIGRDVNNYRWHADFKVRDRLDDMRDSFPHDRSSLYEDHLSRGHYLVAVEGNPNQIHEAETVFSHRGVQDWGVYGGSSDTPLATRGTGRQRRALGVFSRRRDAEDALHELSNSGFPMDKISVIKQDADRNENMSGSEVRDRVEGNKADEGAKTGAVSGGVLGGLTGLLVGLGTLAIPGVGPIMLAGATATTIATTLAGTAIGAAAGGLLGALVGLGIPEERARVYNDRVAQGDYLIIAEGTEEELARVETIFRHRNIEEYGVYDMPETETASTHYTTTTRPSVRYSGETGSPLNKSAIGLFSHSRDVELAVAALRNAGFPMSQITLVGQSFERREPFAGTILRDRFDNLQLGLPDERTRFYNSRVLQGNYAVLIQGTETEIARAESILRDRGIQDWGVYDLHANETSNRPLTGVDSSTISNQPEVILIDRRESTPEGEQRNL